MVLTNCLLALANHKNSSFILTLSKKFTLFMCKNLDSTKHLPHNMRVCCNKNEKKDE